MFKRILVANRGEIALRVIRACREMGIETVAIFSEADRGAAYLDLADEAFCIGSARASDSYLKIDRVISAAEVGNVQAIHPGYGFLAENPHFADVCRSCRIEFIGPSHEAMSLVGDKNAARGLARQIGVPTVPGSDGLVEDKRQAMAIARQIGFPVLIKAAAGGGGRGMKVAPDEAGLEVALDQAQAEAGAAFGNADIYLEKYVEHPRHVEVQVLADTRGSAVHLWEPRLHDAAEAPEADRGEPRPGPRRFGPRGDVRGRGQARQGRRVHQRRNRGVHRRSARPLLLHRNERPHPGRTPGHRAGHRNRPD